MKRLTVQGVHTKIANTTFFFFTIVPEDRVYWTETGTFSALDTSRTVADITAVAS